MSERVKRIIIIGIIGVIGIILAVSFSTSVKEEEVVDKYTQAQMELDEHIKERHERIMNEKSEWQKNWEEDNKQIAEEIHTELDDEIETVQSLKNELGTLVNEDLSIPPQNESRVRYIVSELNSRLGMDMRVENGYIVAYKS
ncbi:MAG: hypothetical protein IJH80_10790 [Ruminococcus sp.]|nr:hypothetical protein [Ruminococcus sp.]